MERRHDEWGTAPAMVCRGDTCVALFEMRTDERVPLDRDRTVAMRHLAFRTDHGGFESAQRELRGRGIQFAFDDHGSAHSIYFRDPDGHQLEITTYELD